MKCKKCGFDTSNFNHYSMCKYHTLRRGKEQDTERERKSESD